MRIGIIGAMDNEVLGLIRDLRGHKEKDLFGYTFHLGVLEGKKVVVVQGGIGKVNAARCAQILIDKFRVGLIINTGVAGAVSSSLNIGDVIVPDVLYQHDFDVTCLGYSKGYMCTGENQDLPTAYFPPKDLRDLVRGIFKDPLEVSSGGIASGDIFVHDPKMKKKIEFKFGVSAVDMESGAIAQVCSLGNVPFVIVRVISDRADGGAPEDYKAFEDLAAHKSSHIVECFLKKWED